MKGKGVVLVALVVAVAVGGIALVAKSLDGPVKPANKAAVVKARKNYLRLARGYHASYSHYEARKRWARQMNRVCHILNRRQVYIERQLQRTGRWQTVVTLFRRAVLVTDRAIDRLRRVPPPAGDRGRVRRMFALYDRLMTFSGPMTDALERRDLTTFGRLAGEAAGPAREANRIATALGAAVCSRDTG